MSTTPTTSSDRPSPGGPRWDDERALERVFRESYPTLAKEAATELEGNGPASTVVSRAFLRAWSERDHLATPEALDSFLHRAVHDVAVREKYRRAVLHHMQEHAPTHGTNHTHAATHAPPAESVDAAWAEVSAALHSPAITDATEARHALSRHGTAEHVAHLAERRRPWGAWAIALLAAAALAVGARVIGRSSAEVVTEKALASADARILFSGSGQRALVALVDQSKATLGPNSRLIIPPGFGTKLRTVRLEGTASFDVAPGQELPFAVRAGNATVTALGTTFDVAADTGSAVVMVRARTGRLQLSSPSETRTMEPGQALMVARDGSIAAPAATALASTLGWTDGQLVVTDRPLREVLPLLRRWYALDLQVKDSALLDRRVTMAPALGVPRNAIGALESAAGLALTWEGERMVLVDRSAKKPVKGRAKRR
ncbi:MAG TPA: FecR domain-containing protein [Gemmatimonadaceae bacterium]|nr:FecR domain-containing protein [Gemmatimonadaceae bacterium]